jgi:hypothetical protein
MSHPSGAVSALPRGVALISVMAMIASLTTPARAAAKASSSADLATTVGNPSSVGFALASGWSIQSTPNPTGVSGSALKAVSCPGAMTCIAVGDINDISGPIAPLAERWNGTAWSIQSNPPGQSLTGVSCTSATACTTVGPGAYRWNGTAWSNQPTPSEGSGTILKDVSCTAPSACIAVGYYTVYRPHFPHVFTLAERWNGTAWSIQSTPNPNTLDNVLDGESCTTATACTAVGSGVNAPLAERWNGTGWSIEPTPKPAGTQPIVLFSVSCPTTTDCTAVGDYTSTAGYTPLAEQWNGTSWTLQSTPTLPGAGVLEHVTCATASACTAVGWGGADGALVEHWDGTAWTIQPTPNPPGGTLSGVSCTTATACTAVGSYTNSSGTEVTLAENYSG